MDNEEQIIFLDIETEGLSPLTARCLEVAAIVADKNFEELYRYHCIHHIVHPSPDTDDVVLEMHTKNGLWEECRNSPLSEKEGLKALAVFFKEHRGAWLAGRAVRTFDAGFLEARKPGITKPLSHRTLDLRTLIRTNDFVPGLWAGIDLDPPTRHRAMEDASGDADTMRQMIQRLRQLVGAQATLRELLAQVEHV